MSPVAGMNFAVGSYEKFQPVSDLKRGQTPVDEFWREIRKTKQT